jgi:predicted nucleotidyltransferase
MEEKIIETLRDAISGLLAIYLFGSRAQGRESLSSDTDIAFLRAWGQPAPTPLERWELQEKLASVLNVDVDLLDLSAASTVMRFEVLSKDQRIFCAEEEECAVFEMLTYSFYQKLEEERKLILQDIAKRGSIYG